MLKDEVMEWMASRRCSLAGNAELAWLDQLSKTVHRHMSDTISLYIWEMRRDCTLKVFSKELYSAGFAILTRFQDGTRNTAHLHDYVELTYIVSGSFTKNIGGRDCTFRENDVVIINQGVPHLDLLAARDACIVFLNIHNRIFEQLFGGAQTSYSNFIINLLLKRRADYSHIHGSLKPEVRAEGHDSATADSILQIVREICRPSPGSSHIIYGHLLRAVYHLAREYRFSLPDYSVRDMRRLLYDEVLNEMRANCRDVTVEDLQKKYFYQRDYFNRLIKEYSGFTFRELRQRLRLEEAGKLLLETDMRVEEVSLAVGYENQGFFYRIFTEYYGATPRAYRLSKRR